jgi:hypothetical protein
VRRWEIATGDNAVLAINDPDLTSVSHS